MWYGKTDTEEDFKYAEKEKERRRHDGCVPAAKYSEADQDSKYLRTGIDDLQTELASMQEDTVEHEECCREIMAWVSYRLRLISVGYAK